jgi:hypothetical protein
LNQPGRKLAPLLGAEDERDEIQVPRHVAVAAGPGGEATHAMLTQHSPAIFEAQGKLVAAQRGERSHERLPMRTEVAGRLCGVRPRRTRQPRHGWAARLTTVPLQRRSRREVRKTAAEWQRVFLRVPLRAGCSFWREISRLASTGNPSNTSSTKPHAEYENPLAHSFIP